MDLTPFDVVTGVALVIQTIAAALCVAKIASSRQLATRIVALVLLLHVGPGGQVVDEGTRIRDLEVR